ncbi:hypothetical protein KGR20_21495 [Cytobacillus oceanisediminis]|uniref:hypothetical protein n=1 Tax=Cytobacillus oceanisediminis TaxID=665099 RepID=UPI001CCCCA93|nr:hypothetical protein [Cytobacillus oceanisediminis]MBZ9536738.1 hypothetical protein [Cytobacillus oceanisediminis]
MKQFALSTLIFIILIGSASLPSYGKERNVHWGDEVIQFWINAGYIEADSKLVNQPDRHLTRQEVAELIHTSLGLEKLNNSMLLDFDEVDWIKHGVIINDNSITVESHPNKQVSIEESIIIISSLLNEKAIQDDKLSEKFIELSAISNWGKDVLKIINEKGIYVSNGEKLRPLGKITFAELLTALDKVLKIENTKKSTFPNLDFEDGKIPHIANGSDSTLEIIENSTGSKALKVNYSDAEFPSVKFTAETSWNFGDSGAIAFEVTNPTDKEIAFYLRIDDDKSADGVKHSTVSSAAVAKPNSTQKFFMSLGSDVLDFGMRFLPPNPAGNQLGYGWGEKNLDSTHIVEFQLWQMYPKKESTLIFDNIKVISDPNTDLSYMDNLVDKYGQYTGLDWEDKVKSDQDLLDDKTEELSELSNSQQNATSKYGGWLNGPKLEGTGHFRVTKHEGMWTLVDPEGYLFFSNGLDILRLDDMNTWISGRENMFNDLPSQEGSLGDHYRYTTLVGEPPLGQTEGWLFNHYSANLERKYGEDYINEWKDISIKRFKNWGFNSLGNWSDPELFFGKGEVNKFAYVANGWTHMDAAHATIPGGGHGTVADPFDPEFEISVDNMIQNQILDYGIADDKWLIGVYIDNEIPWGNPGNTQSKYSVITNILAMDAAAQDSYAKRTMIQYLKESYNEDIAALNSTWGTTFTSFKQLEDPFNPTQITEAMVPDYSAMLKMLAREYFSIVDRALEKELPNTLYLGSRFAEWGTSKEVQEAAAEYVDVVSFNIYKEDVNGENWMHLEALDMPTIIGEFAFASDDRGMFGTGPNSSVVASSQENRGEKYKHYMKTVLESPYFVGAHWFQYVDQPLLGRAWDGENYNLGFVDVADVPYEPLVTSAKEIHSMIYDIKFNGTGGSDE